MNLGTTGISTLYVGSTEAAKAYIGSTEAWSSFHPLDLSPAAWWDATDASTLYDATSGGSLVAADGSIARWEDKSGNANHATQSTSGYRPIRKTSLQNGRDGIRFDGSDDHFNYTTSVFSYTGAATVFAVTKGLTNGANDYGAIIAEHGGAQNSIGCCPVRFPNAGMEPCTDVYAPGGMRWGSTITESSAHVLGWSWSNWSTHKSNGSTILEVDGTESGGTSYGSNPTGFASNYKKIGHFDSGLFSGSTIQGDVLMILVYTSQLSSTNRAKVSLWLRNYFAI